MNAATAAGTPMKAGYARPYNKKTPDIRQKSRDAKGAKITRFHLVL